MFDISLHTQGGKKPSFHQTHKGSCFFKWVEDYRYMCLCQTFPTSGVYDYFIRVTDSTLMRCHLDQVVHINIFKNLLVKRAFVSDSVILFSYRSFWFSKRIHPSTVARFFSSGSGSSLSVWCLALGSRRGFQTANDHNEVTQIVPPIPTCAPEFNQSSRLDTVTQPQGSSPNSSLIKFLCFTVNDVLFMFPQCMKLICPMLFTSITVLANPALSRDMNPWISWWYHVIKFALKSTLSAERYDVTAVIAWLSSFTQTSLNFILIQYLAGSHILILLLEVFNCWQIIHKFEEYQHPLRDWMSPPEVLNQSLNLTPQPSNYG